MVESSERDPDTLNYKFNQIMGGDFHVKNLDRVHCIPTQVVALVRRGRDYVSQSFIGSLGNKIMISWSWSRWIAPLLKTLFARYPFVHSFPPILGADMSECRAGRLRGLKNA